MLWPVAVPYPYDDFPIIPPTPIPFASIFTLLLQFKIVPDPSPTSPPAAEPLLLTNWISPCIDKSRMIAPSIYPNNLIFYNLLSH